MTEAKEKEAVKKKVSVCVCGRTCWRWDAFSRFFYCYVCKEPER